MLAGIDNMEDPVEIDEAYFGGKEPNKHECKKTPHSQGGANKTSVVGIKDSATNRISAQPVSEITQACLTEFIDNHAVRGSKKYTDENRAYQGLNNHEAVKHSVGEYVRGQAHVNGMESFWAMTRRGYDGTFHHISETHLHRYVNKFAGRHNVRGMDTIDRWEPLQRT